MVLYILIFKFLATKLDNSAPHYAASSTPLLPRPS